MLLTAFAACILLFMDVDCTDLGPAIEPRSQTPEPVQLNTTSGYLNVRVHEKKRCRDQDDNEHNECIGGDRFVTRRRLSSCAPQPFELQPDTLPRSRQERQEGSLRAKHPARRTVRVAPRLISSWRVGILKPPDNCMGFRVQFPIFLFRVPTQSELRFCCLRLCSGAGAQFQC